MKVASLGAECLIFVTREDDASELHARDAQASSVKVAAGRPKLSDVFDSVAKHYISHHEMHLNSDSNGRVGCALMCCGPEPLVCAAKEAAVGQEAMPVDLHEEAFEF